MPHFVILQHSMTQKKVGKIPDLQARNALRCIVSLGTPWYPLTRGPWVSLELFHVKDPHIDMDLSADPLIWNYVVICVAKMFQKYSKHFTFLYVICHVSPCIAHLKQCCVSPQSSRYWRLSTPSQDDSSHRSATCTVTLSINLLFICFILTYSYFIFS